MTAADNRNILCHSCYYEAAMIKKQTLKNEAETLALGARLSSFLEKGDCLVLAGALGAGKTCLARGLIQKLTSPTENVPSPTFTLVQTYETTPPLWHIDLYRVENPSEITELGILEALDEAALLVEWADRMAEFLPDERLEIRLDALNGDFAQREAQLQPFGKKWEKIINAF
jgi:tRNA threonylcarbamoyladenosine biosynthesis protein TsaE